MSPVRRHELLIEQLAHEDIPPEILAAAVKVRKWFAARGINVWALAADWDVSAEHAANDRRDPSPDIELP
jgi:hypothetical protein